YTAMPWLDAGVRDMMLHQPLLQYLLLPDSTLSWQAQTSGLWSLALAISSDNLATGLAGSAFIAYLSSLTNTGYTATQYALFSSLMTLPGKFIGGFSGMIVDHYDYVVFFALTVLAGMPAIVLAVWLLRYHAAHQPQTRAN